MKAIILAGGLGERLRPLTEKTPKPLLPVNEKPLLQHCIENLKKHGIVEIILSVGYKAEKIKEYFQDGSKFDVKIRYNIEEEPLGTGGAVKQVVNRFNINENFLLLWGDNLANFDISSLIKAHNPKEALITMALTSREDVENFGVAKINGDYIEGFIEKPPRDKAPSNLINAGAFLINPKALNILPIGKSSIEKQCFEVLAKEKNIKPYIHEGYWFPIDTLEKYNLAKQRLKEFSE